MSAERIEDYLNFIQQMLHCPPEEMPRLFVANKHLVDDGLVLVMQQVATTMSKIGMPKAEFLQKSATEFEKILNNWKNFTNVTELFHRGEYVHGFALLGTAMQQSFLDLAGLILEEQNPNQVTSFNNSEAFYKSQGCFVEVERIYKFIAEFVNKKRLLGEENTSVALSLNNLAELYRIQGRFSEAELLQREALEMWKRLLGEENIVIALSLNNLAAIYKSQGRFTEAERLHLDSLQMKKSLLGEEDIAIATSLNNLAELYRIQGRFSEAEPLYMEALQMRKCLLGEEHFEIAQSLNNLALLYQAQGRFTEAERFHLDSLQMRKRLLGEEHIAIATSLNNLGALYQSQQRFSEAEPFCREALEMFKRLLGKEHPSVAQSLNNLAALYRSQGRVKEAELLHLEALQIRKHLLGEEHPDIAESLHNLAFIYHFQGRLSEAELFCREALEMWKRLLGKEHPSVARSLYNLAGLLAATNRFTEALALSRQATEIENGLIRQMFAASSENDRLTYLETIRNNFCGFLSLVNSHLSNSLEAKQAAYDLVLKRKALTATAFAAFNYALYSDRYSHLAPQFKQWQSLRAEQIHLIYSPPLPAPEITDDEFNTRKAEYQKRLSDLEIECKKLEKLLASQVPEIQLQQDLETANRRAVALELPEGSTLVEFVRFGVFDFQSIPARGESQSKPARYLAFILPAKQPDKLEMIDLGEAGRIDALVLAFRSTLSGKGDLLEMGDDDDETPTFMKYNNSVSGMELQKKIFNPIAAVIGNSKHLLVSPDGGLNLLPLQLLPNETETGFLMDEYTISYLSVGRDILRSKVQPTRPATAPLIIADPDFNLGGTPETRFFGETRFLDSLAGSYFTPVPGTGFLGEKVAQKLGVEPYLKQKALESLLTKGDCPRILLIATHGYFDQLENRYLKIIISLALCPDGKERKVLENNRFILDEELIRMMTEAVTDLNTEDKLQNLANKLQKAIELLPEITAANRDSLKSDHRLSPQVENPMLRSGLALAGANTWLSGGTLPEKAGKGFLFAQDVAALDLWANELTVLSACNTAMGDVKSGEGVLGLRRAFAVAGSKSLVMSLWPVPDKATALLMDRFFDNLQKGFGRADALKEAQNYVRTITVGELKRAPLGLEVLKGLLGVKEIDSQVNLSNIEDDKPLEHPFYWGAWICQGDISKCTLQSSDRASEIFSQLLRKRIIFLGRQIDNEVANIVVAQLLFLEAEDSKRDIYLYINSSGGSVVAGMGIYDAMQAVSPNVVTVCIGLAGGIAAIILSVGTKGKRMALPASRIRINKPFVDSNAVDENIEIQTKEILYHRRKLLEILAANTGQTLAKIYEDTERDYFMSSMEAKEYGIIDHIVEKTPPT